MNHLGGAAKRDSFGLTKEKLSFPGPADYDGKGPGLSERMRKKYNSELRNHSRVLNKSNSMTNSNASLHQIGRTSALSRNSSEKLLNVIGPGQYEV